jgi:hypothetical protein
MECLLQYLDDLDDAVYALALLGERIRRACIAVAIILVSLAGQVCAIVIALSQPAVGAGAATLLAVTLMYRSVTSGFPIEPRILRN